MENNLLLAIPTDSNLLSEIFNENTEKIRKVTLISVDFQPIEIYNGSNRKHKSNNPKIFNQKQDQAVMFDVVGLIVEVSSLRDLGNDETPRGKQNKKVFLIANEVMYITKGYEKLISINGHFDVLSNELISKVYTNFAKLKSVDLTEIEDVLELSKDESAVKAFYKLGSFFTAKKYEINNNIFNLIEHQEQAELVAKKVLLKKMVAWEIRE